MADRTPIEWTDATWNPIGGCSRVSEGCRNCYAEIMAARFSKPGQWGHRLAEIVGEGAKKDHRWTGVVKLNNYRLDQPLRWKTPRRIFVNSTSDLFQEAVPDEWIDQVFAVMALCPQHTFQVLTKRPERARRYFEGHEEDGQFHAGIRDALIEGATQALYAKRTGEDPCEWLAVTLPLPNVWIGTSIEDQATADARIPALLAAPAAVHFASAEPLLGKVIMPGAWLNLGDNGSYPQSVNPGARLGWIIVGGESGKGARPMHPAWARSLRDQCAAAGVPFFFKQWGEWVGAEVYREGDRLGLTRSQAPGGDPFPGRPAHWWSGDAAGGEISIHVGKREAGALLDGREHREFPA